MRLDRTGPDDLTLDEKGWVDDKKKELPGADVFVYAASNQAMFRVFADKNGKPCVVMTVELVGHPSEKEALEEIKKAIANWDKNPMPIEGVY